MASDNPHPVGSREWAAENTRQWIAADPDPQDPTKRRFHGSDKPRGLAVPRGKWPDAAPPESGGYEWRDCPRCDGKGGIPYFYNPRYPCPGCHASGGQQVDPWGRWEESSLYGTTPLKPVRDWGWHLYEVLFWRDEAHAERGGVAVARRMLISSERGVEDDLGEINYPHGAGLATWSVAQSNVEARLRFERSPHGGTAVVGAGWVDEPRVAA